jgi:hypothetical protein
MDAAVAPPRRGNPPRTSYTVDPVPSALRHGALGGLLLWLIDGGVIAPHALERAGVAAEAVDELRANHGPEQREIAQLMLCGDHLTKEHLACLLRPRLSEVCLAASTPAEAARVARVLQWMPEWVWSAGDPARGPQSRPGGELYEAEVALARGTELELLAELRAQAAEEGLPLTPQEAEQLWSALRPLAGQLARRLNHARVSADGAPPTARQHASAPPPLAANRATRRRRARLGH